jgi:hypothetical protein
MPKQPDDREHVFVAKVKNPGRHRITDNLYLVVGKTGSKSWLFRYKMPGKKAGNLGMGSFSKVTLSEARERAAEFRKLVGASVDPKDIKKDKRLKAQLSDAKKMTFKNCAEAYIEAHKDSWRNAKHTQQWENTLKAYAYPLIGDLPVSDIDVALVMKVLEQKHKSFKGLSLWKARPETANRLRGRIEAVLDLASTREYRVGENPARWRGKLVNLLPKRSRVQREHHPALPYARINDFITALANQEGSGARALELVIYTACRTSKVIGARWSEIDLKLRIWIIPANRIKSGRKHRVPLSAPTMAILKELNKKRVSDFVFPSRNLRTSMSNMAMLQLLKRMERTDITVHGFRSSFRDWAAEQTNFPREIAEAALAHVIGDVEAAYRRSDLFEKRRKLMNAWAKHCQTSVKNARYNVTPIRGKL